MAGDRSPFSSPYDANHTREVADLTSVHPPLSCRPIHNCPVAIYAVQRGLSICAGGTGNIEQYLSAILWCRDVLEANL